LRETAEVSTINHNYLDKKLLEIPGVTKPYNVKRRVDQARYSLQKLKEETGMGIRDVNRRLADFGVEGIFQSHHPWVVPEPFTPEPCETYSKADIDYWVAILRRVCNEAYTDPDIVNKAPHNSFVAKINAAPLDDPEKWAMTWRTYVRKMKAESRGKD
jgi:glycine dehydrogenase subunit 2